MMNVDNVDMDLGLALSISNLRVKTRLNNSSGAGVNAGSRVEKTFVASDPLKELVWSPQNGPSLKCAGHSFVDKKYSFQWDAGPSNIVCSPSHSIITKGTKAKKSTSEGNLVASQGTGHLNNEVSQSASLGKSPKRSVGSLFGSSHSQKGVYNWEVNSEEHSNLKEDKCKQDGSRCNLDNIQLGIVNTTVTAEISSGQIDQRTANLLPLITDKPRPAMDETKLDDIGEDHQRLGLDIALASNILTSGHDTDKLEATAENDIQHFITVDTCEKSEKRGKRDEGRLIEVSSTDSRMLLYQLKGKEKEKYSMDRELGERMSKDLDESQESMESCNSAKLLSKGKRRWSFDHQFVLGSKRIKRQIQESPSSTSLAKQDSSFMNWISNMVKGLAKYKEEEGRSRNLLTNEVCHPDISSFNTTQDGYNRQTGFKSVFQSIYLPNRKMNEAQTPTPLNNYHGGSSNELVLACKTVKVGESISNSSLAEKGNTSAKDNSTDPSTEDKPIHRETNISNARGSLWITRYSTKVPLIISNFDQRDESAPCINHSINRKCSELSKSSTGIVSVASKGLQNCVPNTESSICSKKNGGNELRKSIKQKPSESRKSADEMTSLFARRLDALKHISSVEENNVQDKELISPQCNIAIEHTTFAPYGMFDAVRKLRLSRTNVLKWMNSHFSVSNLDGYFLRLRLGKWKDGPEGAGYYVACITGSPREKSPKGFKKHIYVTVGGVECVVESQYVSNQDFQEDELKAWWHKASESGRIPEVADLKVKLRERTKLGF